MNCTEPKDDGKPTAADWITYFGVPFTLLGVAPLFWNMIKALVIYYRLSQRISDAMKPYFRLIADPAAGTVTVVNSMPTPKLDQPGLWGPKTFHIPSTRSDLGQRCKQYVELAVAALSPSPKKTAIDDATVESGLINDSRLKSSSGSTHPSTEAAGSKGLSPIPQKFGPIQTIRSVRGISSWMNISELQIAHPPTEFTDDEQRYIVDADMRTEPVALTMEWPQFLWFALAIGVDQHCQHFTTFLDMVTQWLSPNHETTPRLTLCNSEHKAMLTMSLVGSKITAELTRADICYDIRRAFAHDHIMIWHDSGAVAGGESATRVLCRSLKDTTVYSINNIAVKNTFIPRSATEAWTFTGCSLKECVDTLAATWQWLDYTTCYALQGSVPASEELLEMRERAIISLCVGPLAKEEAWEDLRQDLALPHELRDVVSRIIKSSVYVKRTAKLIQDWDRIMTLCHDLANAMEQCHDTKNGNEFYQHGLMGASNRFARIRVEYLPLFESIERAGFLPNERLAEETSEAVQKRQDLLVQLTQCSTWHKLREATPLGRRADWTGLEPRLLARYRTFAMLCIALAAQDAWHRNPWTMQPLPVDAWHEHKELMFTVWEKAVHAYDSASVAALKRVPPGKEMFANGAFEAPATPLRSLFNADSSRKTVPASEDLLVDVR